jgi:hypothetical protein
MLVRKAELGWSGARYINESLEPYVYNLRLVREAELGWSGAR